MCLIIMLDQSRNRQTLQILALLSSIFVAGCATHYHSLYPDSNERAVFAMTALYEDTRVMIATNGVHRYVLVPEPEIVHSAEAILLRYSQSEEPTVRGSAASRLAHFGTKAALSRALELAHDERSPEIRAGIWSAIAELLQSPLAWPLPQIKPIAGLSEETADTNITQILSSPDLRVVISCWSKPADFIMPQDVTVESLESEIINQYATDAGTWSIAVFDRIPFVPFSGRYRTLTLAVRQSIADALQWSAQDNKRILPAFQEFSRDQDEAVSTPARGVVEALSRTGTR
jgi:hypothetical protein